MISVEDYGIWERGDKTNHGVPELNATSLGMAKVRTSFSRTLILLCRLERNKSLLIPPAVDNC